MPLPDRLATALADRYRLERELGAGGMATVFLAEDVRHRRKVAIKVLHPELSAVLGPERFLKEIELTASLQHPHILPLFDSGSADGQLWYAMPFVEGETLRARLERERQLPVGDAVRLATEVAGALQYAHERGVVHRDIKPENILLQGGHALVADFGIALAVQQAGGARMTQTGMSLGTPQYMAPEQAMGDRAVDARVDVYALGAVTYEMLAGEPPFTGPSPQAIVARVMTERPRALATLRETVAPQVEQAVMTALQKLPADRYASAAELAAALAATGAASATWQAPVDARQARWKRLALTACGVAVAMAALAAWGWTRRPSARDREAAWLALPFEAGQLPVMPRDRSNVAELSPDGRRVAYLGPAAGGASQLWVRELDRFTAEPIPGTTDAILHAFSPRGDSVVLRTARSGPIVVALSGGEPLALTREPSGTGLAWGEDGHVYFSRDGLFRVATTGGGTEERLTTPDTARGERLHLWPHAVGNGRGVVFITTSSLSGILGGNEVAVLDLRTREVRQLFKGVYVRWVPGLLLHVDVDGTVFASPFDEGRLEVTGPAVPVVRDVALRSWGLSDLSASLDGSLLFARAIRMAHQLILVGRDGVPSPLDSTITGEVRSMAFSPDGRTLALSIRRPQEHHLYTKRLPDGPLERLTDAGSRNWRPSWSADGDSILFVSNRAGPDQLYIQRADGGTAARLALSDPRGISEGGWSPDGRWMLARVGSFGPERDILAMQVGVDSAPRAVVASPEHGETAPAISPDGRWLAFVSDETGVEEVYVRPFPNVVAGRRQVSSGGGSEPRWVRNTGELLFRDALGQVIAVSRTVFSDAGPVRGRVLFQGAPYGLGNSHPRYDVSADGQRFVMARDIALDQSPAFLLGLRVLARLQQH